MLPKIQSPGYTEGLISSVKSRCRWMARKYATKDFILDDEAYFTLTKHQMPGNNVFSSNNLATSPPEIKFKFQKKFQLKLMLYVAVSNAGVSQPYLMPSGLTINQNVYQNE